jgi:hypothetical protein
MKLHLDPNSIDAYRTFLQIKQLPIYSIRGRVAEFPDEYASRLGIATSIPDTADYTPPAWAFDYQRDIARLAIDKQKFAIFADCGLGKTIMLLEWAKHVRSILPASRNVLIVSPLMVVGQTIAECQRFYGDSLPIERIPANMLDEWMQKPAADGVIGITNYDALKDTTPRGCLGALALDESSMLKSMYGKWGQCCIDLGKGLDWKLCLTGTPAPNDRIEYGNHAAFLDQFPTLNSFLARFFVNRGQTDARWELKPHALEPFYRALSHWCIFLSNPGVYGWQDNCKSVPPIDIQIHDIDLTAEQHAAVTKQTGDLFAHDFGGITSRTALARIGKGSHKGKKIATKKPEFIRELVNSWSDKRSTIIWCKYNDEQDQIASLFPQCANIDGSTPLYRRLELIDDFKAGRRRVLVTKSKILGFGLNLQVATKMVFSTCQDSYEDFYQAIKRANRIGSTETLGVHIPVTELERPMVDNVLRKARQVQKDTEYQEQLFRRLAAA